eukprot:CAMPEP_0206431386 /NCGR_PEP_ID=MMETSP0324_2-20121206/7336_1 /ASSEMBLY_ACC=CAM_ASM_000836 /TAXON_ID=2866 /ORGANISM="Crypthecodinium cohnii, Strain Seligo" /LENGTH=246 /DNA_ID=CAMNT_0053897309 /DNA_START=426 /DNA_END=1167 /DNA_ORIENTATION=+
MDSPSERYYIDGLRVTRVDDRGARDFSIHWDQYKQQWQWGMHGRLALHWLADDKIAWVPEGVRESPFNHRVWRWQRWGQPLQHSQSQPNRARIVPPAPANAEGRHPPNHYGPVSGRASVRSLSVVAPYQQQQQQQQHGRQQPQDWNHYNPSVPTASKSTVAPTAAGGTVAAVAAAMAAARTTTTITITIIVTISSSSSTITMVAAAVGAMVDAITIAVLVEAEAPAPGGQAYLRCTRTNTCPAGSR